MIVDRVRKKVQSIAPCRASCHDALPHRIQQRWQSRSAHHMSLIRDADTVLVPEALGVIRADRRKGAFFSGEAQRREDVEARWSDEVGT